MVISHKQNTEIKLLFVVNTFGKKNIFHIPDMFSESLFRKMRIIVTERINVNNNCNKQLNMKTSFVGKYLNFFFNKTD